MIDLKTVVKVDIISLVLVGTMRDELENQFTGKFFGELQLECSFTYICSFVNAAEILSGLDMLEYNFSAISYVDCLWMLAILVFRFEIAIELSDLFFCTVAKTSFFLFLNLLVEEELIMKIEVTLRNYLEERFTVKIDFVVVLIGLIVNIWVSESISSSNYPLEMIRPLFGFPGTVLTPWRRIISPHWIFP